MNSLRIALVGHGKMGTAIESVAMERNHTIAAIIDAANVHEIPQLAGQIDVAIEFTTPETAATNIRQLLDLRIPVVSGTTGWMDQYEELVLHCEKRSGTFFYASNYSIGVNIFFEVNRYLAQRMAALTDYKVSLEETHHIHKKDAPSGTALTLLKDILAANSRLIDWEMGPPTNRAIGVNAKREGEVPGTHQVIYTSDVDTIQIEHKAHSRKGFALGAVLAAEFIYNKTGVFNMRHLLASKL